jgi:hypothetical protein
MTRQASPAHEDLGYRPPPAQRPAPSARSQAPRQTPRQDPTISDTLQENDFTRWYAEDCRRKGIPNILERNK